MLVKGGPAVENVIGKMLVLATESTSIEIKGALHQRFHENTYIHFFYKMAIITWRLVVSNPIILLDKFILNYIYLFYDY